MVSAVGNPSSLFFGLPLRFWRGPHRSIALAEKRKTVPLFKYEIDFLSLRVPGDPAAGASEGLVHGPVALLLDTALPC